jgi:predicted DNA-binding protein
MSDPLPRSDAELEELAAFYSTHDTSDEIDAGQVVTPEPMITTSLRLPGELVDRLRAEAAERGIRYTTLIREVLMSHVTEGEPSSRALAARLDGLAREYDRRLRQLEDAQRHMSEIASEGTAQYTATPPAGTDAETSGHGDD